MKINLRLKELRKEYHFSQCYIAKYLDVAQSTISKWENKLLRPSLNQAIKMIKLFNVSLDYFVGLSNNRHTTKKYAKS